LGVQWKALFFHQFVSWYRTDGAGRIASGGTSGWRHADLPAETSMKRILVTGGAGFPCSHLRELLLNEPDEAIYVDNFFAGSHRTISRLHKSLPMNDSGQRQPDISRAKAKFGREPRVTPEKGLKEIIAYFWKV
jgi:nucleoside-diphosphate-sugar epimerase